MKRFLFNSVTISIPKNTVQFALGVILYWVYLGMPNIYLTGLALAGFLISYSAVYLYNDIVDHEDDKKDKEKLKWKLVAGGHMKISHAMWMTLIFAATGLVLSLLVNRWFFMMIVGMLFLNFLHSSPYTRYKKSLKKTAVNLTAIEFLKFCCGWFALTTDLTRFPFWLILAFSVVYTVSYLIYKFNFRGKIIKENKKIIIAMSIIGAVSYVISFLYYGFPLSMIFLIVIPMFIVLLFKQMDIKFHKINNMIITEYLLLPVVILSFMILAIPMVGIVNDQIADTLSNYTGDIIDEIPDAITEPVENLTDELKKYETLEDIEDDIKEGLGNITEIIPA